MDIWIDLLHCRYGMVKSATIDRLGKRVLPPDRPLAGFEGEALHERESGRLPLYFLLWDATPSRSCHRHIYMRLEDENFKISS